MRPDTLNLRSIVLLLPWSVGLPLALLDHALGAGCEVLQVSRPSDAVVRDQLLPLLGRRCVPSTMAQRDACLVLVATDGDGDRGVERPVLVFPGHDQKVGRLDLGDGAEGPVCDSTVGPWLEEPPTDYWL